MSEQQIAELYGESVTADGADWAAIVESAQCPYLGRQCLKRRKSEPEVTIGTCSVVFGDLGSPVMICPFRLLQKRRIFADAVHLMASHEPGNELHVVPEYSVPGGSIDYMLVSVRGEKVVDFVGIELQTLDTTGTVWPARERFLASAGLAGSQAPLREKRYGMNWKMTAKTVLLQLHHKLTTFEHVDKRLVLVLQDVLLDYMSREFRFGHMSSPRSAGDSMHFHAYRLDEEGGGYEMRLAERVSTDDAGMAEALGLRAQAKVELPTILSKLGSRLSDATLLQAA